MRFSQQLGRYTSRRATRRLARELPWVGAAIVLFTAGRAIRRKGMLGGTLHTALDFMPLVGVVKITAELLRGRDFFPDKPLTVPPASTR